MKKVILSIAAFIITTGLYSQEAGKPEAYKPGKYEVYVLTEGAGDGDAGILIDASAEILAEYASGNTFPIATNAVLVCRGDKVWLIDTGYGMHIFEKMAEIGIRPEDVDHVLLTHMHGDHIGGMFRDGRNSFPNAEITVSRKEYEYWSSDEHMNNMPQNRRGNFVSARKVFQEYGERLKIVDPYSIGDELPEGISPVAAYGHTPGHIMFMVKEGWQRLLVWGDLTHAMAVQMPHPEISVTYDFDPGMARESRMEVLDFLDLRDENGDEVLVTSYGKAGRIPVIGMHVPAAYPGKIYRDTNTGGYKFIELSRRKK